MTHDKTIKVKDIDHSLNHSHHTIEASTKENASSEYIYDSSELDAWIEKIMD